MRIQAINTSFKGLFTDKSSENGGNWRMEYSPYSWESNNTSKMAPKEPLDIYASKLPDNEEIFRKIFCGGENESSKDILGTESYYKRSNGTMRRTITEVPAMDRETSLRVLANKMTALLNLKQIARTDMEKSFAKIKEEADKASTEYNKYSEDYKLGMFTSDRTKRENKELMDIQKGKLYSATNRLNAQTSKYIDLMSSIDIVKESQEKILKEAETIKEARESGKLIDISRRDIENPNAPLIKALQDLRTLGEKLICLPHRIMTIKPTDGAKAEDILRLVARTIARKVI